MAKINKEKTEAAIKTFKGEIDKLEKVLLTKKVDNKGRISIKKLIGNFQSKIECLETYPIKEF